MVTRTDYVADAVEAARSVLLELTRLLGGDLLVHSEAGRGSTFVLYLPLAASAPLAETDSKMLEQAAR